MSTHCGIALRAGETFTTIYTIYCHHDGYPDYMYPMLNNYYGTLEKASALVSLGDASYIAENLEASGPHSFDKPDYNVCCFYHRDRGEDWISCQPTCYTTSELFKSSGFEYVYIFEDGQWNAYYGNGEKIYL